MKQTVTEKIYMGLLGMEAGMRLGIPFESPYWNYEDIRRLYPDIRGYTRSYPHFAADDDINGPIIFLRTLTDDPDAVDFTARQAGETWLNYTRFEKGMFWWGGEDISTEHRVYRNLKRGIEAPFSGSSKENGKTASEQIGGQIFVDTWGLVCPGDPKRAASFARTAASVSHDGEGLNGAAFIAACIAAAFECSSVDEVLDAGLSELPLDCEYRRAVEALREFYLLHPDDFHLARDYIAQNWGQEKYPGACHIIPNAAVCVLALLYGEGKFDRSIEISVMCGFDTDSNASTVGTILGVLKGEIPKRYRAPINDSAVLSSVSGFLNMVDFPTLAKEISKKAFSLKNQEPEGYSLPKNGDLLFDFALPDSTHGLEVSDNSSHELRWEKEAGSKGNPCLRIMIDGKLPQPVDLFIKGDYIRSDFADERYDPVFSPRIYPGQQIRCRMKCEQIAPASVTVTPYVTCAMSKKRISSGEITLTPQNWTEVAFTVPDLGGDEVHDAGWRIDVAPFDPPWVRLDVYLEEITVSGKMNYTIATALQRQEFGQVTPFSFNECFGEIQNGKLKVTSKGEGQAFTGNYYAKNQSVKSHMTLAGCSSAGLILRGEGCRRFYALGIFERDNAAIKKFENGRWKTLAQTRIAANEDADYLLCATAKDEELTLNIDGKEILKAWDSRFQYGMVGIFHGAGGKSLWSDFTVTAMC